MPLPSNHALHVTRSLCLHCFFAVVAHVVYSNLCVRLGPYLIYHVVLHSSELLCLAGGSATFESASRTPSMECRQHRKHRHTDRRAAHVPSTRTRRAGPIAEEMSRTTAQKINAHTVSFDIGGRSAGRDVRAESDSANWRSSFNVRMHAAETCRKKASAAGSPLAVADESLCLFFAPPAHNCQMPDTRCARLIDEARTATLQR